MTVSCADIFASNVFPAGFAVPDEYAEADKNFGKQLRAMRKRFEKVFAARKGNKRLEDYFRSRINTYCEVAQDAQSAWNSYVKLKILHEATSILSHDDDDWENTASHLKFLISYFRRSLYERHDHVRDAFDDILYDGALLSVDLKDSTNEFSSPSLNSIYKGLQDVIPFMQRDVALTITNTNSSFKKSEYAISAVLSVLISLPPEELLTVLDARFPEGIAFEGKKTAVPDYCKSKEALNAAKEEAFKAREVYRATSVRLKESGKHLEELWQYVYEPYKNAYSQIKACDPFALLIADLYREKILKEVAKPLTHPSLGYIPFSFNEFSAEDRLLQISYCSYSAGFWGHAIWFIIKDNVTVKQAEKHEAQLVELLRLVLLTPQKVRKFNVPKCLGRVKSLFAQNLGKIVQGKTLVNSDFLLIDGLAPKDLYQHVIVAAEVISSTLRWHYEADAKQGPSVLDEKDTSIVDWIWQNYMQPKLENLVEWVIDVWVTRPERRGTNLVSTGSINDLEDEYLQHLILEEEAQKQSESDHSVEKVIQAREDVNSKDEHEGADSHGDYEDLPEEVSSVINGVLNAEHDKWYYVDNPKAESWNVTALDTADEDFEEALDVFFRRNKVTTVVPTASVARAVRYFEEAQQGQGVQIPGVVINGVLWSKVKRGKARILCRLDERDQLYFHVYPRREWTRDMFD